MATLKVGYAGMTHLGLNSAVACAARGADVTCFDEGPALINELRAGRLPVREPQLPEFWDRYASSMVFSSSPEELRDCQLVIVAPDVPTDAAGHSDLEPLTQLIGRLEDVLPETVAIVVLSQVPPGFCRPLAAASSHPFYYQVETLIFGQAIERALNPERIISGCSDPSAPLYPGYAQFLDLYECPVLPMRFESAELAKIAINCCLVSSISVANMLAELCEKIGADWSEIAPSLKLDRRIGAYAYLTPGLGIAGGNLERDLNTVIRFAAQHGTDARVARAWVDNSRYRRDWVLRLLYQRLLPSLDAPRIAIWGLAYKQDTHSTKNSPALALIVHLSPYELAAYDPLVPSSAVPERALETPPDALTACEGADILIIMTPWPQFREVAATDIKTRMRGSVVIDPYAVLDSQRCKAAGLSHFTLGRAASEPEGI